MPGFIKLSTNINCMNKSRRYVEGRPDLSETTSWQLFEGQVDDGAIERLFVEFIMTGYAVNASPFEGTTRGNKYSIGGNVCVLDFDDGIAPERIINTPTYQRYGMGYAPSSSSGVVSKKKGVDGRPRGRGFFRTEREFNTFTDLDENGKPPTNTRRNLERIATTTFFADNMCADLGIPKLEDTCHQAVSQPWFGTSGEGFIDYETKDENGVDVRGTYPCSTDREYHINREGCLPAEDIDRIVEAYLARKPEILLPRKIRSDDQIEEDVALARYILNNDLLSEEQLMEYTTAVTNLGGCCKALCESLRDDWLETMARVDDGHPWRLQHNLMGSWDRLESDYDRCVGSIVNLANEASPGWRSDSPFSYSGYKSGVFPIGAGFSLLHSISTAHIIR